MAIRIVRLGSKRTRSEGTRIGTVRRPPRGVPKADFAKKDWFDVWLPNLAPSAESVKLAQGAEAPAQWKRFEKKYRTEMAQPENARLIEVFVALSHHANFSMGCYCENEAHCHRSVLRAILQEHGAKVVD